jgi:hypothetical protein
VLKQVIRLSLRLEHRQHLRAQESGSRACHTRGSDSALATRTFQPRVWGLSQARAQVCQTRARVSRVQAPGAGGAQAGRSTPPPAGTPPARAEEPPGTRAADTRSRARGAQQRPCRSHLPAATRRARSPLARQQSAPGAPSLPSPPAAPGQRAPRPARKQRQPRMSA